MPSRPPLVLGSRSPQRRALLTQLALPFRVVDPAYREDPLDLPPARVVEERACGKARSVRPAAGDGPVLGVDTEVALDGGEVLGKPADPDAAAAMLARLQGRTHLVLSGVCVRRGDEELVGHDVTAVRFRALRAEEISAYVAHGEWTGRAGGYAVQGVGAALVERIEGCYPNVVGLPVALLVSLLGRAAYPVLVPPR
jgi:septum formation protein